MAKRSGLMKFSVAFILVTVVLLAVMLVVFASSAAPQIPAVQSIILNQVPQTYLF